MADPEYIKALKLGQKAAREAQSGGKSPYLPALDQILEGFAILTEEELGLMDIPLEQIVGTKTIGRQNSFACNFMPLMSASSEFAMKWGNLYKYQIEEGVADPIVAYEFLGRYYVLEGNKRVSVFKYLGAFSIEGQVRRIIPVRTQDPQIQINYEFMEFFHRSGINYLWFSKTGGFAEITKHVGKTPEAIWDDRDREDFSSRYTRFCKLYDEKGGEKLSVTKADAFVMYLNVYRYKEMDDKTDAQINRELDSIWKEFPVINTNPEQTLMLAPEEEGGTNLFSRLFSVTGKETLNVAFIHEKTAETSSWTYVHELGRAHLEQIYGSDIRTSAYFMDVDAKNKEEILESVIEDGNDIIFTTSQRLLDASLRVAIRHPKVRILNCSVNRPYQAIRTYYGRMYEAKFLGGMIAGAMAENDKIAYAAGYPIFGEVACINAFALGAQMTNPRAKIYLNWEGSKNSDLKGLVEREGINVVSDIDMIRPGDERRRFGIYRFGEDGHTVNLAAPLWNWGKFYEKIIRDIATGSWNTSEVKKKTAVNYWWGISSGIIDLIESKKLPEGLQKLVKTMKSQIFSEQFNPFSGRIKKQDGTWIGSENTTLRPEDVIQMDYLVDQVIGSIPTDEELTDDARAIVAVQGVHNFDEENA